MSLSGLDSVAVDSAYKSVQEERGGWFLLSYATRASVDVLAQGAGGVHEMCDAARSYYSSNSDVKPLFGIIQFRRRKVVIKIVPEDTSLLFKARVQVHWLAITTRFPNYDSTYEITTCEDLEEHALTRHIELHSSRSSSGSTKKPALDGIEEDAEEASNPEKAEEKAKPPERTPKKPIEKTAQSPEAPSVKSIDPAARPHIDTASLIERSKRLAAALEAPELKAPEIVEKPPESKVVKEEKKPEPKEYALSVKSYHFDDDSSDSDIYEFERRMSSQTARPSTSDYSSYYNSLFKPKVRLRPRPSVDRRPRSSKSEVRPVASLPAGMRAQRPGPTTTRPKSRDSHLLGISVPPPPPIPEIPTVLPPRPGSSRASIKSLPATLPKSPGMTPEKARLMKFREIHRQREARSKARVNAMPDVPPLPAMPKEYVTEKKEEAAPPRKAESLKEKPALASSPATGLLNPDSAVGLERTAQNEMESQAQGGSKPESATAASSMGLEQSEISRSQQQPTPPLDEPASINSASSPISVLESSGLVSTRPTSIAESSVHEKADVVLSHSETSEDVGTPSTVVDNKQAQSPASQDTEKVDASPEPVPSTEHEESRASPVTPASKQDEENASASPVRVSAHSRQSSLASAKAKRHGMVPQLSVNVSASCSEVDYDEDLMDELDAAEVVEAKSMSVSKSPITPVFPAGRPVTSFFGEGKASLTPVTPVPRKAPSPLPSPTLPPEGYGTHMVRSPSGTLLSPVPQHQGETITVAREVKIGTGIAAKIADLQRSFSRGSAVSLTPSPSSRTPETSGRPSVYQRASALRSTPPRASSAGWQLNRPVSKASISSVDTESPERERPHFPLNIPMNVGSRISAFNNQPQETPTKPDTISVTATIVRTERPHRPSLAPPTAGTPLELHESPLVVKHGPAPPATAPAVITQPSIREQRAQPTVSQSAPTIGKSESTTSLATATSPTETSKEPPGASRRSTDSGWRKGRHLSRSEAKSPKSPTSPTIVRSLSNSSLETVGSSESVKEGKEEKKKGSRASRLIRRMSASMSSLASVSRLPLAQLNPSSARPDEAFMNPPISPVMETPPRPEATDIGDLNVQFPDTLLWKRRWVEIDNHGFIVLKPYGMNNRAAASGIVKKYHLHEFNAPFTPDLERQEMPNSIILDFKDGRTLQLSCQSPSGQKGVLKLLADSYHGWKDAEDP